MDASDSVYFNSTRKRQKIDDRDLEEFETHFEIREYYSPRVKALALRTLAKDLVAVAWMRSENDVQKAISQIVCKADGTVDTARTYDSYIPYFPVD